MSARSYSKVSEDGAVMSENKEEESLVEHGGEVRIDKVRNCKDLWKWFIHDPWSRWPLMIFLLVVIACILWIILSFIDYSMAYIPAGILGILTALFGAYHFKQLMSLKAQVDTMEKNNVAFRRENAQLSNEVNRMEKAQIELTETESRLKAFNKKNSQNLERFKKLNDNLNAVGSKNVQGMTKIYDIANKVGNQWGNQMLQNQREMYLEIFDKMEFKDKDEGLNKEEYETFLDELSEKDRIKLTNRITFEELAGDDNKISFDEFTDFLSQLENEFKQQRKQTQSPFQSPTVG